LPKIFIGMKNSCGKNIDESISQNQKMQQKEMEWIHKNMSRRHEGQAKTLNG
jgi:hypothetical protein